MLASFFPVRGSAQDTDGDGLPDAWETQYQSCGFDPLSSGNEFGNTFVGDVRVTWDPFQSDRPLLAWTGSEYGVTWTDYRDGNAEIYFARVSAKGKKIGADLRVTSAPDSSWYAFPAWTGSEFGVAWRDKRDGNYEIYFTRISASGSKIGDDVRVTYDLGRSELPWLTWTGSEFGLGWMDTRSGQYQIYFARFSAAGVKISGDIRVTYYPSNSKGPSLAWTGSEYGVSWLDDRDGNSEIYFARLSAAGSKMGDDLRITFAPSYSYGMRLVWTGFEYGLTWEDWRGGGPDIYFVRLSAAGAKIGSDFQVDDSDRGGAAVSNICWTGSQFGLSWQDFRNRGEEVYFTRLSEDGNKIGEDLRVTYDPSGSMVPWMAWTGSEFGVTWYDRREGNSEIYLARISGGYSDRDGDGLDEEKEYDQGTDPCAADTDGDGMPDGWEVANSLDPLTDDSADDADNDGLSNLDEYLNSTDPNNTDTDGGGEPDGSEVSGGRNPLDGTDDIIPPSNLKAVPLDGALVMLTWDPSPSPSAVQYNLYSDNATGTINYAAPVASVPAGSPLTYTVGPLVPGIPYKFVVRVEVIGGGEDGNTDSVSVVPFISQALEVRACITHPSDGHKFNGNLLLVKAEVCAGNQANVSQVLLEWRPAGGIWSSIPAANEWPNPDPSAPYFVHWDVSGLDTGIYELRAVAYGPTLAPDPDPPEVSFRIEKERSGCKIHGGAKARPSPRTRP